MGLRALVPVPCAVAVVALLAPGCSEVATPVVPMPGTSPTPPPVADVVVGPRPVPGSRATAARPARSSCSRVFPARS
jgi:hypothetical protein